MCSSDLALGALFAGQSGQNGGVAIKADGSNINPVALRILNLKSPDGPGYLFPTPQVIDRSQPFARQGFSVTRKPCSFGEDQGMMNLDFLQTEKSKFVARGFYATSKQTATFGDRPGRQTARQPCDIGSGAGNAGHEGAPRTEPASRTEKPGHFKYSV